MILKVPSGQIESAWEWYHWIGLQKDIDRYRFFIFYFWSEYLIKVQSSELLHAKMNPTSYLFGSRFACAQTAIFSAEPCSKNSGETSIVLWITACDYRIPTCRNPKQIRTALFKYSRVKLKNQKPIAVDVLFKAYPMVQLSCRSSMAGRYLQVFINTPSIPTILSHSLTHSPSLSLHLYSITYKYI